MALVRWVTEMGMGVDVHGGDHTKAARRAVSDALRHSSLNFFAATDKTRDDMHVEVIVAVAEPDAVDIHAVMAEVPYGTVTARAVSGGLDVPRIERPDGTADGVVIANAAVLVSFPE